MNLLNRFLFRLGFIKIQKASGVKIKVSKNKLLIKGKVVIEANSYISAYENGEVVIYDKVKICENSKILACNGKIVIREGSQLGDNNYLTGQGGIEIGNDVLFASNVSLISNEHRYEDINTPIKSQACFAKPIIIKDGTWIGINSTVLAGTTIGKNCVIGANSLVKGKFPDYCVIAGNPANIVKIYDHGLKMWRKYDEDV